MANVKDVAAQYAEQADISKKEAEQRVRDVISVICSMLCEKDEVRIPDYFTLSLKTRSARTGIHPKTGESINIPAKRVLQVKASKAYDNLIND